MLEKLSAFGSTLNNLAQALAGSNSVLTVILVFTLLTIKAYLLKLLHRKGKANKRLKINIVNNTATILILVGIFNIWSAEFHQFAISIAAFVVAIVIATREFIQCFIGFLYIVSSRPFRIGDWIQVEETYGEVHSIDWAKLTLLEIDIDDYEYTGKTLYLPNSKLITSSIKNLNFLKRYVMHHFTITRDCSVNPFIFLDKLYVKAYQYCADFSEVAVRYNQLIESRLDVKIAGPEPHIQVLTSDVGNTQLIFTIFCPTNRAVDIQQSLTADFMKLWFEQKRIQQHPKPD